LLLAVGGGPGRIVRDFRWPGQFAGPGLKRRDPRVLRRDASPGGRQLPEERDDQRIFPGAAQDGQAWGRGHQAFRIELPVIVLKEIWQAAAGILVHWTGRPTGHYRDPR